MIIGVFERAVGFYATLVNINAYHQPGVEAGKKAAGEFLKLLAAVKAGLAAAPATGVTAGELAGTLSADPEDVWHCLNHLASNGGASRTAGTNPADDRFTAA
jgi:glucose-6-phosphate isomerase